MARSKRLLYAILSTVVLLLAGDRYLAHKYLPSKDSRTIVMYSTVRCPYCKYLRKELLSRKIPFIERDIEKSIDGMLGFWALRGRGVPITVIGPEVVYGFQLKKIDRALRKIGYKYYNDKINGSGNKPTPGR